MPKFLVVATIAVAASVVSADKASAQFPGGFGFAPFGFYQPFGARYSTSIRTPPYFATNPPVYYGARHARPYGLSPFAAPPQVQAGVDYRSRMRTEFLEPVVPTPDRYRQPLCNPYIHHSSVIKAEPATKLGEVRTNPFVDPTDPADRIARNET